MHFVGRVGNALDVQTQPIEIARACIFFEIPKEPADGDERRFEIVRGGICEPLQFFVLHLKLADQSILDLQLLFE